MTTTKVALILMTMKCYLSTMARTANTATWEKFVRPKFVTTLILITLCLSLCISTFSIFPNFDTTIMERAITNYNATSFDTKTMDRAIKEYNATDKSPSPKNVTNSTLLLLDSFNPSYDANNASYIVLLTCSDGFWDMFINWLAFFKRLHINNLPVHLFAEDLQTFVKCQELSTNLIDVNHGDYSDDYVVDLSCISWDEVFPETDVKKRIGKKGYRSDGYKKMMSHRPPIVQHELEVGHNVIFSDVDAVWKSNPLPYFQSDFSADIWAQRDGMKKGKDYLCPGFMIYRSCPATIELVNLWKNRIAGKNMRNQGVFNHLLSKLDEKAPYLSIETKTLPPELFVTGSLYFKNMTDSERSNAVVVHNNGISGYDNKVDRMREFGLWIV